MVRGAARFTSDHTGPGTLQARFVRSLMAHARIASIDLAPARAAPGVVAVYAAADLDAALPACPAPLDIIINRDGTDAPVPPRPALARHRVRFAGEAVALVVATTACAAADGAEAVAIQYDPLPAATFPGEDGGVAIHPAAISASTGRAAAGPPPRAPSPSPTTSPRCMSSCRASWDCQGASALPRKPLALPATAIPAALARSHADA